MKTHFLSFLVAFVICATPVLAQQTITLNDGTQLKGELVSVTDGSYTVHTATMGDVTVQKDQISSITTGNAPAPAAESTSVNISTPDTKVQIQNMQNQIMANPQAMADIQALANDPEIMKLLSDPTLMQAALSKDVNAVQGNPRIQELMENPKMKALMEKLQGNQTQQQ